MKIERVRKGTEMMNKLDGKNYRVTAVFCDEAGKVMEATAAEMIENEAKKWNCPQNTLSRSRRQMLWHSVSQKMRSRKPLRRDFLWLTEIFIRMDVRLSRAS